MKLIEEIRKQNDITYGLVQSCYGIFQRSAYLYLIPKEDSILGAGYGAPNHVERPVEFLIGMGIVCQRNGDYDTHFV
ncbi:MAG TPA: hypothetical protein VK105_14255 [Virgibacillus sp.]|nr:hypothetical protein [Virgibacillus sp.]HLR68269.1 hypothetical protein [Virgibacillus sp.]